MTVNTRRHAPHLLMVLKRDDSYGSARLNAEICYRNMPGKTFNPTHEHGAVLNPHYDPWKETNPHGQFQNLTVSALVDTSGDLNNGQTYGWEYSYRNVFEVKLDFAQQMFTTLRWLDGGMKKLRGERGAPGSFAEYLTNFANVIGCTQFAEYSKDLRADGTRWIWMDIDQMRSWVHNHERQ